jgi:hypothetical protein
MATYAASGIIYAKATPANLAVAISPLGGRDEDITDRINPPTLETGKITASVSSDVVTGIDVDFERDCKAGEYIFAYGAGAVPVLVGRILSVDGPQQLTLTGDASSDADEAPYGLMKILLTTNENILIRVPRIPLNEKDSWIPNWSAMRVRPFDANQYNDSTTYTSLTQYSETGVPIVIDSGTNVPFLIQPSNRFTVYTSGSISFCWRELRELPNFIFAVYNPFGNNSQQNLSGATMYKLFTTEQIPGLLVTTNFSASTLAAAGYSVAADATSQPPPTE